MKKPLVNIYPLYQQCRAEANETNDCTVVSLAFAMDWTYKQAHDVMRLRADRKPRKPASLYVATRSLDGLHPVNGLCPDSGVSLGEFCRTHHRGRYVVSVTGHALVVVDGQIHDHSLSTRRRVKYAWRVNQ